MLTDYQRLARTFAPQTLCWILDKALDHATIVKLCNTCGLSYAGMRTKSVPAHKLVLDLVDEFFEHEDTGELIIKTLMKATIREASDLRRKPADEIIGMAQNGLDLHQGRLSRLLVAMALDERTEVNRSVTAMLAKAEPFIRPTKETKGPAAPDMAPPAPSTPEEPTPAIQALRDELQSVSEELARAKNQSVQMEARVEQLREQVKKLQVACDALRRENRELSTALGEREREVQRLTDELKKSPALVSQVHQLERENRKLLYDLEKFRTTEKSSVEPHPSFLSLERSVLDVRGVLESTIHTLRAEQGELKRLVDDLYKEVHTLRVEAQKDKKTELTRRPKGSPERVGIFVDVQNMFYAARQYGARLDFEKLLQAAVGDRRLIKAVAYVIQTPEVDQTGFVAMLQQRSYQVRRKDLRLRSDGSAKGDWDMGMAIDMLGIADKLDVIVLVSGDGDFVALVNLLKEIGPRVEVFSFPHNTARDLMEVADRYYAIDEGLLIKMDRLASTDGEREKNDE